MTKLPRDLLVPRSRSCDLVIKVIKVLFTIVNVADFTYTNPKSKPYLKLV